MGREAPHRWPRSAEPPAIPAKARPGQRIRAFREWRGLTRAQLAGLVGQSESWLYQIEHGVKNRDRRLALPLLQEIAGHVVVTVEDLVGESVVGPAIGPYRADRTVLAVLPVRCTPGDRVDDFLAAGMCDDLVTRLSKIRALLVIGPESTGPLVEAGRTVASLGHELGAHAVLTSTLAQRTPDEVHSTCA
jgi:TolB-like protein